MFPVDNLDKWQSGKGYWSDTSDADWNDWKWQMRNRLSSKEQIQKHVDLTENESLGLGISSSKLLVSITPHFLI